MKRIYDGNLCYDFEIVPESNEWDSCLFNITKTVYGDKECRNTTSQRTMERRLRCDDNGNVYCGRSSKRVWFNWHSGEVMNHYSLM